VGAAQVFVKAAEIDEVKSRTMTQLGIATAAGIGVALLVSAIMATVFTGPIRALVSDMRIVSGGKLDHKTHPRSHDEIGVLAATFNQMTKSLKQAQEAQAEKQAIEHELNIANEIQTKLLPDRLPQIAGFDIFSYSVSAREVGGDYYDFMVIDPAHLGIVVADVSGKGIPGAMVMTMVRSLMRLASHREASPAETMRKVNRILAKDIRRGMFVTAIYSVLDVPRKTITVASAGHNPIVYYAAATKECRAVNPSGIALGFDKGRTFDENILEETIELKPGDRVVAYTDGIVEAMNEKQEEYGMERFTALVRDNAQLSSKDFVNAVMQAVAQHRGRAEQSDDITITTLRVE
jgi:sigma-B regulation protein RsbU (phosphoserine phosphatase)